MPHNKSRILNRISRIFHHKEDNSSIASLSPYLSSGSTKDAQMASLYNNNLSLPVLLQRAPSSKLLIEDDFLDNMCSTIEHSSSFSEIYESTKQQNRQSWFTTLSKLKTFKTGSKSKRKSSECWFITEQKQRGSTIIEIPDQQQQQQEEEGVITIDENDIKRMEIASPLSVTSSVNSRRHYNKHQLSSSSSFWLPIEQCDISTARTSIDSEQLKNLTAAEQSKRECISLAVNVKNILGDAILLADNELNI